LEKVISPSWSEVNNPKNECGVTNARINIRANVQTPAKNNLKSNFSVPDKAELENYVHLQASHRE